MPTDQRFEVDGVEIAYDDLPPNDAESGPPVVLIHGFASSRTNNWEESGWYDHLRGQGRRVVALDNRGHGESGKPHDPTAYDLEAMAGDAVALLDHLEIEEADVLGYSMGGRITTQLVASHPDRLNAAMPCGIGDRSVDRAGAGEDIASALLADDVDTIETPMGRRFRLFAEETGNDLEALAAVIRAQSDAPDEETLAAADLPVLVVAGTEDDVIGDPADMAAKFGNGESVVVEGTDHLETVETDRFKNAVSDFLDREGLPVA